MALVRYAGRMATIQVRDLSEAAYETIRRRARAAGQSIQAYMREQIERLAGEPTDEELFAEVEAFVARAGVELGGLQVDLDADRR